MSAPTSLVRKKGNIEYRSCRERALFTFCGWQCSKKRCQSFVTINWILTELQETGLGGLSLLPRRGLKMFFKTLFVCLLNPVLPKPLMAEAFCISVISPQKV